MLREMKCGGTCEERAKRLFLCKGIRGDLREKLCEAGYAKVFVKRKAKEAPAEDDDRRDKKQQGPILEHQWWAKNQKRLPYCGPQY